MKFEKIAFAKASAWQGKKVIVTGGAGVIGRVLVDKLVKEGSLIRCFDINPKPKNMLNVEYSQRDLSLLNPLEFTSFDPEFIFHLAATFERTEESDDFWEFNFTNNVLLSHKVIDAAKYCGNLKKFIFASSYLIYDPELYLKEKPGDIYNLKETDRVNARNICGAAKYYTEQELKFMKFPFVSARIFRVYGRNSRDFISRSTRNGIAKKEIELFLKENSFDYIFADDVAEGLVRLAESDIKNRVFNLGFGKPQKIETMISILKQHFSDLRIKEAKKTGFYENSSADMTKFKEAVGWQPQISLEEGIKKIIDHETQKKNQD